MDVQNRKSSPWLIFQHGRRKRSQTFFNMAVGSYHVRNIRQMRNKDVWFSFRGWLLLRDSVDRVFLFNPVSLTEIEVPQRPEEHHDCIFVLSAPPTDPNCQLIMIKRKVSVSKASVIYICRIIEDKKFTEVKLSYDGNDLCSEDGFIDFHKVISCEGKIYFLSYTSFGVIDVGFGNRRAILRVLVAEGPRGRAWYEVEDFLVESCGEVFLVLENFHDPMSNDFPINMVFDFLVFKMNFSQRT